MKDPTPTTSVAQFANSRFGLQLFAIYSSLYLAFVLVNAFMPQVGEWIVFAGLNLAVVWGFALIAVAFVLAMFYGTRCVAEERSPASESSAAAQSEGRDE